MRAVLTVAHGDRSQLVHRPDYPDPVPASDEVVIRIAATAINYHDIFTRRGMPGIKIPLPVVVGSDLAGEVVGVGAAVTQWNPGDRVLVDPVFRDGKPGRCQVLRDPAAVLVESVRSVLAGRITFGDVK